MRDTTKLGGPPSRHHHQLFKAGGNRSSARGQSLVEFVLVLPMLLILLMGVADFGRVFAAGITMEAATRDAAEAAAQEYVQIMRNKPSGLTTSDYERLHEVALYSMCQETQVLPNRAWVGPVSPPPLSGTTIDNPCSMPPTAVCIHDADGATFGPDPFCNGTADFATPPGPCSDLSGGWSTTNAQGTGALPYVEVRSCYQFTTLFNLQNLTLPFGSSLTIGDIYLQRTRTFTVACYYSGCA
jgi:hypothetical protein